MEQETGISLRDTLNALFRRISILWVLMVILPVGTLLATFWVSPVYETAGKLLITGKEQSTSAVKVPTQSGFSSYVNLNVEESDLNSEMELLLSLDLWTQTVKKLGLPYFQQEETWTPLAWFADAGDFVKNLLGLGDQPGQGRPGKGFEQIQEKALALRRLCKVEPVPKSRVLDVTFRYNDADKVQHILTTFMDTYIPYRTKIYSVHGAIGFFSKEVADQRAAYEKALTELMEFKKKWGVFLPDKQMEEQLSVVRQIDDSIVKLDGDIKQYQNMLGDLAKNIVPTGQLASFQNPVISVIAAQVLRATERNLQVRLNYGTGTRDIGESEAMLRDLISTFREAIQGELNNMISKKVIFESSRKEKIERLTLVEEKSQESGNLELTAAVAKERYLRYLAKVEDVRVDELLEGAQLLNVRIVSKPFFPAHPVFPKRGLMVITAFILAFPLGISLVLVANLFDRTFSTPHEVEVQTGYKVLASLVKVTEVSSPQKR